jgi:hypothetical protein
MSSISVVRIGPFPDDNECAKRFRTALVEFFNRTQSMKDHTRIKFQFPIDTSRPK